MNQIYQKEYPSNRDNRKEVIDELHEMILPFLDSGVIDKEDVYLAIDEAVTNGMEHGNQWNPQKKLKVTMSKNQSSVVLIIEDEGGGFDFHKHMESLKSRNVLSKRGRGIFIISRFCSVSWEGNGNIVKLSFQDSP